MAKEFNPDDFFSVKTVEDIAPKFKHLYNQNYQELSLNEELVKLNYEITSPEYKDKSFAKLEEYFKYEVDTIV